MSRRRGLDVADLRGAGRLAFDATLGLTGVVEAMHAAVASVPALPLAPFLAAGRARAARPPGATRGLTRLVYASVRGVTRVAGAALDAALGAAAARADRPPVPPSLRREAVVAALNGVVGDHLAASGNPLAIEMRFRRAGRPLVLEPAAVARDVPAARGRVAVLIHGSCQPDLRWQRAGHDHGAALERDLGYTPVYLHYNSGLHVSTNGRALSDLLEALVRAWPVPVERLALVGHSMGGLLARSACHVAREQDRAWLGRTHAAVFLGTPHQGAPLERGGNWVDVLLGATRFSRPFARLGRIRSAGVTDLRHGSVVDEDWAGADRFARGARPPRPVPLPEGVRCHAVAATLSGRPGRAADLVGDGLVPLASALGDHPDPARSLGIPAERRLVVRGRNHFDLLGDPEVYAVIRGWLSA